MKICPICRQTYSDANLNFCLNDGGALTHFEEREAPTIFMDSSRQTSPNWPNQPTYQNQQMAPRQAYGIQGNPQLQIRESNQVLPVLSMVLGILSLLLGCCWGGIPLGIPAVIVGLIGIKNANENPHQYGGKGFAIAGLAMGAVSFGLTILMIIIGILS